MNRNIDDQTIAIHQGDALQRLLNLPSASVDAVITDPPYNSGAATLSGKQANPSSKYQNSGTTRTYPPMLGDGRDQRSFTCWSTMWLTECWRIAKEGAPLLVFTDWRQLPAMTDAIQAAGWQWRGIVVWHKASGRPMLGEFRRDTEFVIYASKGKFKPASRSCLPGVYKYPVNTAQKVHLTSKPVQLMHDLLAIAPQGGTVLDPFLGGGTTLLAAKMRGCKGIGIELSPEYARLAAERIANAE